MIDLHFNWAWLLIVVVVILGVAIAYPRWKYRNEGIGGALNGVIALVIAAIAVLVALVIGGIFIW
jgi:phage-related protein